MGPEAYSIFLVAFSVWGIAVAIKAVNALRTGQPYVFGMWDGGALCAGKRLSKLGKQVKVVVGLMMAGGCIAGFTDAAPRTSASYFVAFAALLSIVSDFVTIER